MNMTAILKKLSGFGVFLRNPVPRGCWVLALALLFSPFAEAVTCTSVAAGGNWNAPATWTGCVGGNGTPANTPGSADAVVIIATGGTVTLTANAAALSITFNAATVNNGIDMGAFQLAVTNAITMPAVLTSGVTSTFNVNTGTLTAASIAITGSGTATRVTLMTAAAGSTITTTGSITFAGTAANARFTSAGTTNVGGNFGSGGTLNNTGGTIKFQGSAAQTMGLYTTYNNVIIANTAASPTGVTVSAGTTTVGGTLTVTAGILNLGSSTFNVTGTTTVNTGGTISFNTSTTGTKTFTGRVTVDNGGTWTTSVASAVVFLGGITNNGSFNTGTATTAFNTTAAQTIDGTAAMTFGGAVTIAAGVTVTNNNTNTVTINAVLNGSNVTTSIWVNGANSYLKYGPAAATAPMVTGVFTVNANGNTVEYSRAGNQTIILPSAGYFNLTLSGSGAKNPAAMTILGSFTTSGTVTSTPTGAQTVSGNFTLGAGTTFTAGAFTHSVGGNFSNSAATFTTTSSTFKFNGTANQTLAGTTTANVTFVNLTLLTTNSATVTVTCGTPSPVINGTLTFTTGNLVTSGTSGSGCSATCANQVPIIISTTGTLATPSSSSYVVGAFRRNYAAAGAIGWLGGGAGGTPEYPVGDASNYTPVKVVSGTTTTAGNLTMCTTATTDPNITNPPGATQGIYLPKALNRYWSLISSALNTGAAPLDAKFTFANGDVIGGAAATSYIMEAWNGTIWRPTVTISALANSTEASNIDITTAGTYEIGIGEQLAGVTSLPGDFNAFDTTTTAGATIGMIQTKQAGITFSVRLARRNATTNALDAAYNQVGVTVELYDSSNNSGALTVSTGCRSSWTLIAGTSQTVTFASGIVTATFTAGTTLPTNSYRDLRVHIVRAGAGVGEGCSTDRFALRPQSITVTAFDSNWETAGTGRALTNYVASGGYVHKASTTSATTPRPFTLRATPIPSAATNYDGSPTVVSTYPLCGTLCPVAVGTLGYNALSWTAAGSGVRENATANYSEVGSFNLQLEDSGYASVDSIDGSSALTLTIPSTATVQVGRFVPDHFVVSAASPVPQYRTFNTTDGSCTGIAPFRSFTYIGQTFSWVTPPKALITAQNAANATTANYTGSLWKVVASDVTETYTSTPATLDSSGKNSPTIDLAGDGARNSTSNSSGAFFYTRSAAQVPFTANISLTVSVQDATENAINLGIITTSTSATFNGSGSGIAFDSGGDFRYGRMRIPHTQGSQLAALPINVSAQYWNASSVYAANTDDKCTSIAAGSFSQAPGAGAAVTTTISGGGTLANGSGVITLTKPTVFTAKGSVDVSSTLTHLPGVGRQTFGVYKSGPVIYLREMY
jgi:hypothetical protein